MSIDHDKVNEVIERNDIVDVINEYTRITQKGKNYMGLCPFHREKTPSFSVSQEKQLYHCFGCGASGNIITFIEKMENVDFRGAVKILADRAGIDIEDKESPASRKRERLFKLNSAVGLYFYKTLYTKQGENARSYLKGRGLDDNAIKHYGIGYAPPGWDDLLKYLNLKGYDNETLEKAGLIIKGKKGYYDRFRHRVIFPIFNQYGRVAGFGGRVLDNSKPKYLNSPETVVYNKRNILYGLNLAKKSRKRSYIIVEGYMDCIALQKSGFLNTVASLGTSLTISQGRLLKRYANEAYICYDADIAGQEATLRGLKILDKLNMRIKIILIPEGKDPDEFIRSNGKEAFSSLIKNAEDYRKYLIMHLSQKYDCNDIKQRSQFVDEALKVISDLENEIEIEGYIKLVSGVSTASVDAVRAQYGRLVNSGSKNLHPKMYINGSNRDNKYMNGNFQKEIGGLSNAYINAEKVIIYNILNNTELLSDVCEEINPDMFEGKFTKKVYSIIFNLYKNKDEVSEDRILSELADDDLIKFRELMNGEYPIDIDINKYIEDFLTYKKMQILKRDLKKKSETKNDGKTVMKLQKQLIGYRQSLAERGYFYVRK